MKIISSVEIKSYVIDAKDDDGVHHVYRRSNSGSWEKMIGDEFVPMFTSFEVDPMEKLFKEWINYPSAKGKH